MNKSFSDMYKESGVNINAGYESVSLIKTLMSKTYNEGVIGDVGGFSGLFRPDISNMEEPVLVSGTDGVGTKLKLAFLMDKHDTVGIDCVAMCVNDIICSGARPLFFLDYMALGHNEPSRVAQIVAGIAEGCLMAGCALIGGETAEMPGFYPVDEYDLAGFAVGMVDRKNIIDSKNVEAGNLIIGLPSSGVHSNGFSLVRKIFKIGLEPLDRKLGEILLTPTRIYVKPVLALMEKVKIKAISHITGGGFYENIPRMLPPDCSAKIDLKSINILPVFDQIMKEGKVPLREMFNVFNMGIGMCIVVDKKEAQQALDILGEGSIIGEIIPGSGEVLL